MTHTTRWLTLALGLTLAGMTHAQNAAPAGAHAPDDAYLWLEDIDGTRAMDWVKQQDASTVTGYTRSPEFKRLDTRLLEVLDSDARI
ncbi:MAG TPA: S9 family peptidase, partial [Rhodanobacteraceae bacterium]|nr:S9 family peptidase [Rhodanobacteraceae bacterium]